MYILSFDQEKALDKVDRSYMFRHTEKMNNPQQFADFIKILYQESYSQVQNNGYMSKEFLLKRGVRQGCPLFPTLLCPEWHIFLQHSKRQEIKGFNIPNNKENLKLFQYADDTNYI